MTTFNNKYILFVLALIAIVMGACSDDDNIVAEGIFSPRMVSNYPLVEGNTIKYIWYDITAADTYTFQLSYDEEFTSLIDEAELTEPQYLATDLKYDTAVYARLMAKSSNGLKSIWTVVKATTDERIFDHILYEINQNDVTDYSVIIHWEVSEKNPADMIKVKDLDNDSMAEIALSEADFLKGEYLIENLEPSTNYEICLYNNNAESIQDRPYNPITVKTKGADILHEVDKSGVSDNSIKISWEINDRYPADCIYYGEAGIEYIEIVLTEEEYLSKVYVLTGLKPSTEYEIFMMDSSSGRKYNVVKATTGAAPAWKVPVDENPLEAGVLFENDDVKISSVYSAKTEQNARTICDKGFSGFMQLRVASAPSADNMTGTQQSECTPIIIEPYKNMNFTVFVRQQRQTDNGDGTVTFTIGGGKDVFCFDQSEKKTIDCTMIADNPNVTTTDGKNFVSTESYEHFAKTFILMAGVKYTIYARGTTVRLFGADYEIVN